MSGKISSAFRWVRTEAPGVLLKEALKYSLITLANLVLAWLLIRLSQLLQLDTPLTIENIGPRVLSLLQDFMAHPYDNTIGVMTAHPFDAIIALGFSTVFVVALVLIRRARLKVEAVSTAMKEATTAAALASTIGIGGRWAHSAKDGSGAPWGELCKEILRPENNVLDILGANGLETFGEPGSPLYDALEKFSGTTRVILLHPQSPETSGRASAVKVPLRSYRKQS